MIRVNLLPQKRRTEARAEGKQLWLVAVMVAFLAEIAALFVFHSVKHEELVDQQKNNTKLQAQIDQSKASVANHPEVQKKLEDLRAREAAITKLQNARSGPTAVLLELTHILTPGRGPSVAPRQAQPNSARQPARGLQRQLGSAAARGHGLQRTGRAACGSRGRRSTART